jgi:hypothetical protein
MRTTAALPFLLAACFLLPLIGCGPKVPETTPRYDKNACLICNRFGHPEEAGKCFYCKGTTACQYCNGTGKRMEGTRNHFYQTTCAFCDGTGKCHYCGGTGKCKTCGGTGKYTPPPSGENVAAPPAPGAGKSAPAPSETRRANPSQPDAAGTTKPRR